MIWYDFIDGHGDVKFGSEKIENMFSFWLFNIAKAGLIDQFTSMLTQFTPWGVWSIPVWARNLMYACVALVVKSRYGVDTCWYLM